MSKLQKLLSTQHFQFLVSIYIVLTKPGQHKGQPVQRDPHQPIQSTWAQHHGPDIAAFGIVPPHLHPRDLEVTICLKGLLLVGFVDTSNRDSLAPAVALAGFSSQNPDLDLSRSPHWESGGSMLSNRSSRL
ncbi:hypothetical protein ACFXTO_011823 [Malus domestica]